MTLTVGVPFFALSKAAVERILKSEVVVVAPVTVSTLVISWVFISLSVSCLETLAGVVFKQHT